MNQIATLAQALGLAYASGVNFYATVTFLGIAQRMGWVDPLPGALSGVSAWWVIGLAGTMALLEFLATLVPGVASVWETVHTAIRPPAAAALAVATAWHADPALILGAGILGGGLALGTHVTKLGLRYAVDTSPEPVSNGVVNVAEIGIVASISYFVWHHPYLSLTAALLLLVALFLLVRTLWRAIRRVLSRPFGGNTGATAAAP